MTREFVILPEFEKQWKHIELSDDDLKRLQSELLVDPQKGDVMQGTGGVRKMRFALENRGKSGSVRIIYVDFWVYEKLYLITAYPKNEKDNLSKAERNSIKQMIERLEKILETKKGAK